MEILSRRSRISVSNGVVEDMDESCLLRHGSWQGTHHGAGNVLISAMSTINECMFLPFHFSSAQHCPIYSCRPPRASDITIDDS